MLEGFGEGYTSEGEENIRKLVVDHARKKKKPGGFQSMGLSRPIYKGLLRKGYNVPTPIQRKCIPIIMEGKDVVAMARTGSGKTACFLIPMFQKLQNVTSVKPGPRALIMSPTRELALQTLRFVKDLGRFVALKAAVILGGDSFDDQFAALHENPDIVIATPGRFTHVCVEMNMRLDSIEYVVFDEADRLFEMGFQEQLQDVLKRLPSERQTVLCSATMPKMLVDFARAGLTEPTLIRLDVDVKVPEQLRLAFFVCKSDDKPALLIHLLKNIISNNEQTLVFAATKHHVEYLHLLLQAAHIESTFIYSSLDPAARKINAAKFQMRQVMVLIVTDIAARGIDIPLLDNVINFSFPPKSKLFVHRVGRVARAGRKGTAYSMVEQEEMPYLLDLHLFLGRPPKFVPLSGIDDKNWHGWTGAVAQQVVDDYGDLIKQLHDNSSELCSMKKVAHNGYKQYLRSRPTPSKESLRRVKNERRNIGVHPLLRDERQQGEVIDYLNRLKNFKPKQTVFEAFQGPKSTTNEMMQKRRQSHQKIINKFYQYKNIQDDDKLEEEEENGICLEQSSQDQLNQVFSNVIAPKPTNKPFKVKKKKIATKDPEHFIPYVAPDHHSERGLEVQSVFDQQAHGAVLDLMGDEDTDLKRQRSAMKWDKKRKKYIQGGQEFKQKKIRTESGVYIPASYATDRYKRWKERSKAETRDAMNDNDENAEEEENKKKKKYQPRMQIIRKGVRYGQNIKVLGRSGKPARSEIKRSEQIVKQRKQKIERQMRHLKHTIRKQQAKAKAKKRS